MTLDEQSELSALCQERLACRVAWIHALADFAAVGPFPRVYDYAPLERALHRMAIAQRRVETFNLAHPSG